jgi:putative phage-type endonuclease
MESQTLFFEQEAILTKIQEIIVKITDNYDQLLELYIETFETSIYRANKLAIMSKMQPAQRTDAWHKQRHSCITASDISSALGNNKYKHGKQVIMEKCGHRKFTGNMYTKWGNRYEPVATMFYEWKHNVKVYEAALLIHPIYQFIGASCDGFVVDENNDEGYLIEIKCPYTRIPKSEIPIHYLEQPLTQMEVSKMPKCVFLDCKFEEYKSEDDFFNDTDENVKARGVYLEYKDNIYDNLQYVYPEIIKDTTTKDDLEHLKQKFEEEVCYDFMRYSIERFIFWKLSYYHEVTIIRDKGWFSRSLPKLRSFWNSIEKYRIDGITSIKEITF